MEKNNHPPLFEEKKERKKDRKKKVSYLQATIIYKDAATGQTLYFALCIPADTWIER